MRQYCRVQNCLNLASDYIEMPNGEGLPVCADHAPAAAFAMTSRQVHFPSQPGPSFDHVNDFMIPIEMPMTGKLDGHEDAQEFSQGLVDLYPVFVPDQQDNAFEMQMSKAQGTEEMGELRNIGDDGLDTLIDSIMLDAGLKEILVRRDFTPGDIETLEQQPCSNVRVMPRQDVDANAKKDEVIPVGLILSRWNGQGHFPAIKVNQAHEHNTSPTYRVHDQTMAFDSKVCGTETLIDPSLRRSHYATQFVGRGNDGRWLTVNTLNAWFQEFVRNPKAKLEVVAYLIPQMASLVAEYKVVRMAALKALGVNKPIPNKVVSWPIVRDRLLTPSATTKDYFPMQNPPNVQGLHDVNWMKFGENWFFDMAVLSSFRKLLSSRARDVVANPDGITNLTLLNYKDQFAVAAFNQKNAKGNGTTRMLWPICPATCEGHPPSVNDNNFIHVLDWSYSDIARFLAQASASLGDDALVAKSILSILRNDTEVIGHLATTRIELGYYRRHKLYGVMILESDPPKMIRRNRLMELVDTEGPHADYNHNERTGTVSLLEGLVYVMSILFLAEPRHAKWMWGATLQALELVAAGAMNFKHFLERVPDIEHGTFFPGNNYLSGMRYRNLKPVAMPLVDSIIRSPGFPISPHEVLSSFQTAEDALKRAVLEAWREDTEMSGLDLSFDEFWREMRGVAWPHAIKLERLDSRHEVYLILFKVLFVQALHLWALPEWKAKSLDRA